VSVHADRVGGGVRLADVRRTAGRLHGDRSGVHRRGRPLHLLAREGHGTRRVGAAGTDMTAQASPRSAALAGIGLMLTGVFLFSLNDAVGKWLVATYSVGQLLLIRSGTTLILLSPFIWRAG